MQVRWENYCRRQKVSRFFRRSSRRGLYSEASTVKGLFSAGIRGQKWYGPSFATVAGASWGLQIGAQSIALVLVITNERGWKVSRETTSSWEATSSEVLGPVGRRGELGTDYRLKASMYSYSMTKGLFAGLSLEGAAITVDQNANPV